MDRNREGRRTAMAVTNGLSRRRHRSSSLRDSPEEDGAVELQETARLRDRGGSGKKDRDRDREQDRDRLSRSKRGRADRLMHGSNREVGGEDSSEESVNDEEDDEEDDDGGGGSVRMHHTITTNPSSMLSHRKSFPPATKSLRTAPPQATWKAADEMIGVAIPRKARSASTKRSHEFWTPGGVIVSDPNHQQASTSPVRPNLTPGASYHAQTSPSSNASVRKKLKPNGPKLRPPKSFSKSSSSVQDEMIEIAEVLYGLSSSAKQEVSANDSVKFDSRELNNRSATDAKSRVSSPISNSSSALAPSSSTILPPTNNNINPASSSVSTLSAVAPKRKRPRPIKYEEENNASILSVRNDSISSTTKIETDLASETEIAATNLEKNQGSVARNGGLSNDSGNSQVVPGSLEVQQESVKPESKTLSDSKLLTEESDDHDLGSSKEEPKSPKKDENLKSMIATKANTAMSEVEYQREEKFQIDLMAPPPLRSSPERDNEIDFVAVDPKGTVADAEMEIKATTKEENKTVKNYKDKALNVESKATTEESDSISKKAFSSSTESHIDLHLDLEKTDRNVRKQQQQQQHQTSEKSGQTASLPLPMSVAAWPSGIPPMGYVTPLPGVVSMNGNAVSSGALQPPNVIFPQPRLKRCATHCYIAHNICYHQQISRMNPFWPAGAGSASLYGATAVAKHCNLNVVSSADLHGGHIAGREAANSGQEKGQSLSLLPGHNTKKDTVPQAIVSNIADAAQRKHILLQQPLPPGAAPSNILHGPAFIFPISQQQVGPAATSSQSGSVKPPATSGPTASSTSTSAPVGSSGTAAITAPTMSFNYPNMTGNEAQYLAILQNSGYPFPIPAHVGAPPTYRGTPHGQAMPFFSGSFYPSQVLHPSQLQQQQQQQQQQLPSTQSHPHPQQNGNMASSSSSSSPKQQQHHQQHQHLQNNNHNCQHQPRPHSAGGSLQGGGFPTSTQSQPPQQRQQALNHQIEIGTEHGPSSHGDNRVSRGSMSVYGQNFAMPIHPPPQSFALMTPPSTGANAGGAGGGLGEKKQQQGSKAGGEQVSQAFALSFASINGATTTPGLDLSSIAPNHPIFQNLPEVTRHGYHQIMASAVAVRQQAAAAAHQQKKNFTISEEGKTVGAGNGNGNGDSANNSNHNIEEDRKATTISMKTPQIVGQSIAFSRADLPDSSVSTIAGDTVVDSSARTLNLSGSSRNPGTGNPSSSQQQQFQMNKKQQQLIRLQKQQQQQQQQQFSSSPTVRNNKTLTSNGSVYSDHYLPSSSSNSSMAAKFPNALSSFSHQTLVQSNSNNSPVQSPQWKNSVRSISQIPSTPSSSMKNHLPQQHPGHTQISFAAAANPKSSSSATQSQGQPSLPSSNQSPSPPMMVGSPTTSSMSKSASGSPRTTSASTSTGQHKVAHTSSLSSSSQQNRNLPLSEQPNRKSSPVDGRNGPSILGNPTGTKLQLPQQQQQQKHQQQQKQQQQQLSKQSLQQAQLFFSQPYMQVQASHSTGPATNAAVASGYYLHRQQQQPQGLSGTSSSGMLSLCSVSLSNTSMTDPAKAVAGATAAAKGGGGFPAQTILHPSQLDAGKSSGSPHQLVPANFPYVHAVSAVVPMKPTEQKQPAGE